MRLFAVAAPGLESIVLAELHALAIEARAVDGGAEWEGDVTQLMRALLHLRCATRVLVRAASFRARTFFELERHARRVPWAQFLGPGRAVALRVTARKSKLYHEGAIAERLQAAITGAVAGVETRRIATQEADDEEQRPDAQLFVVRVLRDEFTISADATGAALHRRGYRQALAKAPLRETLAAALLHAARWHGQVPLLDPLCGSGTIPIEAALLARRIPPALASPGRAARGFAFTEWPEHDAQAWDAEVRRARANILERTPVPITGSDRNAGAITAARANAARAGVDGDIEWQVAPLARARGHEGGALITNPPYGVRVVTERPVREVYAGLGELLRDQRLGRVALLSPDPALDAALRVPLEEIARTRNGGIAVRLLAGSL